MSGKAQCYGCGAYWFECACLARIEAGTGETACGLDPKDESRNSSKPLGERDHD